MFGPHSHRPHHHPFFERPWSEAALMLEAMPTRRVWYNIILASPPSFQVAEAVHHLLEILNAYETAMESCPQPKPLSSTGSVQSAGGTSEDLGPVLSAVLDPLAEMCEKSAEALLADAPSRVDEVARLDPAAHRIFLVNCLASVWAVLQHKVESARARQVGGGEGLPEWAACIFGRARL